MIIVRLVGGLGNQMFQYALGRNLATKHITEIKLDISWFKKKFRDYELGHLNILENIATEEEIKTICKLTKSVKHRFHRNIIDKILPYYKKSQLEEVKNYFDPVVLNAKDNTFLKGFWQSELYFKDIEETIRKEFTFKKKLDGKNLDLANSIQQSNSVSVHIRRGDYVSNPEFNKRHGVCNSSYYKKASEYINDKISKPVYYIFSDEPAWVKQNIFYFEPCIFVQHNLGIDSYKDMQLMSLCRHNITANSSFSWWGAWLNTNSEKIVVTPARWFNDASIENQDLIPTSWVRL